MFTASIWRGQIDNLTWSRVPQFFPAFCHADTICKGMIWHGQQCQHQRRVSADKDVCACVRVCVRVHAAKSAEFGHILTHTNQHTYVCMIYIYMYKYLYVIINIYHAEAHECVYNTCIWVYISMYIHTYRVAKTHKIPDLYRSFSAKVTYI